MEFGVFHSAFVPRQADAAAQRALEHRRILDEVEVAVAADRVGFKYSWATEHHFLEEYSHLSASEVFMGFVAARTERIHLGSGIFNLTPPVNPPARTAERVAMLDHLSEGRFELGVGRGSSSTEFQGFGIADGDTTKSMMDEVLPQLLAMWRDGEYAYDGECFSMPRRHVLPKPYTQPHPPLWIACGSPSTFEKAGRLGMGALCFTNGTPDQLEPLIETYRRAIAECDQPVGDYVNENVAVVSRLLCLESRDRALDLVLGSRSSYYQSLVFRYLDNIVKPEGMPQWPELVPEPTREELEAAVDLGLLAYGDPETCARSVSLWEKVGADQIIYSCMTTDLPFEIQGESLALFGREVIPEFDRDPVHRTTRACEAAGPAA
jgi:alkanesulfonate monooxygenase SsuD/methylene tetrahydromethanopterin reductase-like flavin-dependent oxidoreductase (luciferase family)